MLVPHLLKIYFGLGWPSSVLEIVSVTDCNADPKLLEDHDFKLDFGFLLLIYYLNRSQNY